MTEPLYLYAIGQHVTVGLDAATVWRIEDRRLLTADLFGDIAEYLCVAQDGTQVWWAEIDLTPLEEQP